MIPQGRYIIFFLVLISIGYFSKRTYLYYFDTTQPQVTVVGFEDGKAYAGEIVGSLKGWSPYKVAHISMWLDDNLMHRDFKINRKQFDHPISIPAMTIPDGSHKLKFEIVDGTKRQNKTSIERFFYTDNLGLQAVLVPSSSDNKVQQGRCLRIQIQVNKPIKNAVAKVLTGEYIFFAEGKNSLIYETYVPVECEQDAGEYPFSVEVLDRLGNKVTLENTFQVVSVAFKKKILNVQGNKLHAELEFTPKQEQDLEAELEKLAKQSGGEKLWNGPFDVPIVMRGITTEFGVIRTSQERGRRVHKALDLIADPKSVIWASHNGIIVLKDRFTHSGNTVVIDHGCGVLSLYYHLHDFADISVGQKVKKGHPLGRMGMTGYASGDHLHWEMRINNTPVEPMQWTQRWI
ncbi:MAG: M23 family metallopeptidase [Candidatus Dependentiae bacterium]|nr:M23 family metallopeptidase [Candidatus Dependentiae bacterium]